MLAKPICLNSLLILMQQRIVAFQAVTENHHVLVGHAFQQLYSRDWFNCIQACHDEPRCISYNYERSAGANGLCELNDCGVDDFCDRDKSLIYSVGFVFQQIRECKRPQSSPGQRSAPTARPTNLTVVNTTSTSILITWETVPANEINGEIWGYKVNYRIFNIYSGMFIPRTVNVLMRRVNLTSLSENTKYNVSVLAFNQHGEGPASDVIVVKTNKDKPDGAPQNVTAVDKMSTSILITWDEVLKGKRNGHIKIYKVNYTPAGKDKKNSQVVKAPTRYLLITNLQTNTNYSITVLACNVIGCGRASKPISVATCEGLN